MAGAIFGAVTAAINIVTTLVSLVMEGYGFCKQAYKLIVGYMMRKRLQNIPGSALVKHLRTVTWKRIKARWGPITLRGGNILADLWAGIASVASLVFSIVGAATSPTGFGPAAGALASTVSNLAGGIGKGVLKGGGSLIAGWHKLNLWLRQQFREWASKSKPDSWMRGIWNVNKTRKAKHEQRAKSAVKVMKRVAALPAYSDKTHSSYDEVKLLVKATGVDMQALFRENGKPQEQIRMLMEAIRSRE